MFGKKILCQIEGNSPEQARPVDRSKGVGTHHRMCSGKAPCSPHIRVGRMSWQRANGMRLIEMQPTRHRHTCGHASWRRCRLTQSPSMPVRHGPAWHGSKVEHNGTNCCASGNHQVVYGYWPCVVGPSGKLLFQLRNMDKSGDCWPTRGRTPLE
jgi:hypothetical protein